MSSTIKTEITTPEPEPEPATSDVATHGPDILSTHTESSCTVILQPESTHILQNMNDDQLHKTDFETLPDPVQNIACSNNSEGGQG